MARSLYAEFAACYSAATPLEVADPAESLMVLKKEAMTSQLITG